MMTGSDYLQLFSTAQITVEPKKVQLLNSVCKIASVNSPVYSQVSKESGVPWQVIAAIHFRESDQNFTKHLHNGDPLTARTVHVPRDRPALGSPPFTWAESACDALKGFWHPPGWGIASCLEFIERYNGCGYQKHGINTPYLWDYTSHYTSGLFTADGSFDPEAKESRPGAVAILKGLFFMGDATLSSELH